MHLLENSVADLAFAMHFNEVANFNQFFRRHAGMTPTQFRTGSKQ
ncbi:helix-turn-helix domain-containing protein [Lewinella sp. JB7]